MTMIMGRLGNTDALLPQINSDGQNMSRLKTASKLTKGWQMSEILQRGNP